MASSLQFNFTSSGANTILSDLAKIKVELADLKKNQAALTNQDTKKWSDGFVHMVGVWNTLNKGFDFAVKRIGQIGDLMTGWVNDSLRLGGAFESASKGIAALSAQYEGVDPGVTKRLGDMALQLGRDTEYTATEAANATRNFLQLGFTGAQALEALPKILNLATASGLGLAKATDIAAVSLRQFGLLPSELGKTIDVMSKASMSSGANILSLASSLEQTGTAAKSSGLSFSQTVAALGILGDAGIRFSKAGTDVRNILTRITAENSTTMKAFKELGYEVKDNEGKMKDTIVILRELRERYASLTGAEQNYYSSKIAGARGMSALTILLTDQRRSVDDYAKTLDMAAGATEAKAKQIRDTYDFSKKLVTSSLQGISIALFNFTGGPATKFNTALAGVWNAVADGLRKLNEIVGREGFNAEALTKGFKGIVAGAQVQLGFLFKIVKDTVEQIVTAIAAAAPEFLSAVGGVITPIFDWLKASVGGWINQIFGGSLKDALTNLLIEAFTVALNAGLAVIEGGLKRILAVFEKAIVVAGFALIGKA